MIKNLREKFKKVFKVIGDSFGKDAFLSDFVWAFCLYLLITTFFFQNFFIPSGSMKPTLLEGDYIVVSKYKYGYSRYSLPLNLPLIKNRIFGRHKPQRGDIIVFALPNNTGIKYIKRLIGLPGDEIQVKNKILYINGEEVKRENDGTFVDEKNNETLLRYKESLDEKTIAVLQRENKIDYYGVNNTEVFKVPEGYYFFMGDNRENSEDSRFSKVGFVPYKNIIGEAKIIFFSKKDSILKVWNWGNNIRFNRIFRRIKA
jgi:signal peptidase I